MYRVDKSEAMFLSQMPCHVLSAFHVYCPLVSVVLFTTRYFAQNHRENGQTNRVDSLASHCPHRKCNMSLCQFNHMILQ